MIIPNKYVPNKYVPNKYVLFHIVFYFCLSILIIYIIISGYLRIKMPFWKTQPVFHIYNLKYWLNPPGLINNAPPPVNKFVNLTNNTLITLDISGASLSSAQASTSNSNICKFISDYYVMHESALYKPSEQDILAYLQSNNQPSFFNVYQEPPIPFGSPDREIIGAVSARILNVTLKKRKKRINFPVYYVDNLCVNPGYRKKGIAPEMIQTMYYRVARENTKVNAYLFKREGQLNAIVPLVCYDTYAFTMTNFQTDTILNPAMKLIEIGISQLNLFMAFLKSQLPSFDCIILPDVSCVLNLLKLGKIKIYGILFQGELIALYIFRLLELYYDKKKAAECITILSNCQPDILITGFALSWLNINAVNQSEIILIEETAHSTTVIKSLDKNTLKFKSPTAFFLYNYAAYSTTSSKTLLFY